MLGLDCKMGMVRAGHPNKPLVVKLPPNWPFPQYTPSMICPVLVAMMSCSFPLVKTPISLAGPLVQLQVARLISKPGIWENIEPMVIIPKGGNVVPGGKVTDQSPSVMT